MGKIRIATPIILVFVFTALIFWASSYLKKCLIFSVNKNEYVNFQINYQFCLLLITILSLATTYFLNKENFANYFSVGNISANSQEMKLFGIKQGDTWLKTGLSLSIVISLATALFMYFQLKKANVEWSLFAKWNCMDFAFLID